MQQTLTIEVLTNNHNVVLCQRPKQKKNEENRVKLKEDKGKRTMKSRDKNQRF